MKHWTSAQKAYVV